jgi:hypothetical protein
MRQLRQPVYPLQNRRQPRSDSEDAGSQEEGEEEAAGLAGAEEDEDKKKLLMWKRELEEKFKKFDSFKDRKEERPEARPLRLADAPGPQKPSADLRDPDRPDPIAESLRRPAPAHYLGAGYSGAFQLSARHQSALAQDGLPGKEPGALGSSSRDSNSIKVKDELLANRDKELHSKKFDDSSLSRGSDHRPNFFSRKEADPFLQPRPDSRPEPGSRPSPPPNPPPQTAPAGRAREPFEASAHLEENRLLKQRISDLEAELGRQKRENEHSVKQILENNQKLIQNTRSQYEREIEHLKEQLEEAYIQNNRLEEEKSRIGSAKSLHGQRQPARPSESRATQTADDALEKNFMKLKALYDSLCRSNQELLAEHKEVQEKCTRLAKVAGTKPRQHNKEKEAGAEAKKPAIKMKPTEHSGSRLVPNSGSK